MNPILKTEALGSHDCAPSLLELPATLRVETAAQVLSKVTYEYRAWCPVTREKLLLPRTALAEALSIHLQEGLSKRYWSEGKMFGVLLVQDSSGRLGYSKAYSGRLAALKDEPEWAPPLHLYEPTTLERETLRELARCKDRLLELSALTNSSPYLAEEARWQRETEALKQRLSASKAERRRLRAQRPQDQAEWDRQSKKDSAEKAQLRRRRDQALAPLKAHYQALSEEVNQLKRRRKALSRRLQEHLHQDFMSSVSVRLGCSLEQLYPQGLPTGTGDCCAPKLLNLAIQCGLEPLALAEFWCGPESLTGKRHGEFYPACAHRCQALLGPLLRRAQTGVVKVVYEDDFVLVVDKPPGLLTVPGRTGQQQDCLLIRLSRIHPEVNAVHRLDFETSGLLLLAKNSEAAVNLRQQFAQRQVRKTYQALLEKPLEVQQFVIQEPLAPDPTRGGVMRVEPLGKPAHTELKVLGDGGRRVELFPITGRTHQLRAHLALVLGSPILGDRLYGDPQSVGRLRLHAWRLGCRHPATSRWLDFEAPVPF